MRGAQIEQAGFRVHKTGKGSFHYTVELPKPLTSDVADGFNGVFEAP